jgi:hypothetical protein
MKGSLSVIVQLSSVCSLTSFAVHAEEERKLAHTETNVRNFFRSYRQRKQMDHHLDEATITEVSEEDEEFDEELSHTAPAHSSLDEVSDEMNKVSMDAHTEQTNTHTHAAPPVSVGVHAYSIGWTCGLPPSLVFCARAFVRMHW